MTTFNLLTGDIIVDVIIFLAICGLGKTADLKGFQCISENILELTNYRCSCIYLSSRGEGES